MARKPAEAADKAAEDKAAADKAAADKAAADKAAAEERAALPIFDGVRHRKGKGGALVAYQVPDDELAVVELLVPFTSAEGSFLGKVRTPDQVALRLEAAEHARILERAAKPAKG